MEKLKVQNPASFALRCRSAFVLFLDEGIEKVRVQFPDCVDFVSENKERSLDAVSADLGKIIDAAGVTDGPATT